MHCKFFPRLIFAAVLFSLAGTAFSVAQSPAKSGKVTTITEPPAPLLPPAFDGWVESAKPIASNRAADADAANAAVLNEYGFDRYAEEHYSRGSDTLIVKALQFPDATGAYGAYSFYRRPNMAAEEIGSEFTGSARLGHGGAFDSNRVLVWNGAVLLDAQFSHVNAMTAAEMRDLTKLLPAATSSHALIPPPLPRYLPATGLDVMSIRYTLGPMGYQLSNGVLPSAQVGFDRSAEAVTAEYNIGGGDGTLTLLEYPTPQMAMERETAFNNLINSLKSAQPAAKSAVGLPEALTGSSTAALGVRRSGPIVAITSGNFTERQSQMLLGSIHYDADITWNNTQGYISEGSKTARLLVNIILGSSIICLIALALGIALGGGRALIRVLRGKPASSMEETMEFIKLNLREDWVKDPPEKK